MKNIKTINDVLTEREIAILKKYCVFQNYVQQETLLDEDNFISFEFNGVFITDPFGDEDYTTIVDPVAYYGDAFLNSGFLKLFNK